MVETFSGNVVWTLSKCSTMMCGLNLSNMLVVWTWRCLHQQVYCVDAAIYGSNIYCYLYLCPLNLPLWFLRCMIFLNLVAAMIRHAASVLLHWSGMLQTLGENMHIHISNIDMASEYYPVLRICLPLDRHQRTVLKKPNHSKTCKHKYDQSE